MKHQEHEEGKHLLTRETIQYPTLDEAQTDGLDEREAVIEESITEDGRLLLYSLDQKQKNQQATVEIDDQQIYFTWSENGVTKTQTRRGLEDIVAPSTAIQFLLRNFVAIKAAQETPVHLVFPEKRDTLSFKLIPHPHAGRVDIFDIDVIPTNPFTPMFVGSIYFRMRNKVPRVLEYHGPLMLYRKEQEHWRTVFADVVFDK